MSTVFSHRRSEHGFTLIELMVVVGIIGILVSIAIPKYEIYQRRTRQVEAKLAVAAIYGLEKSFYSEYTAYAMAFDAIGYSPEGARRFYYHAACFNNGTGWTGTVTGYTGTTTVQAYAPLNSPFTYVFNPTASNTCGYATSDCATFGDDPQTFLVAASGTLCPTCKTDTWTMNHNKILSNCSTGTK
jgi:prepilin-type N-terminal cleavage/methylation domain-containing protein